MEYSQELSEAQNEFFEEKQSSMTDRSQILPKQEPGTGAIQITEESWELLPSDYILEKKIGKGSFGEVKKAVCARTGEKVAIKLIPNFTQNEYHCVQVIREISIMR